MPPAIATLIFVAGIVGLFWLDRDPEAPPSPALWIPTVWLLFAGSRSPAAWLNAGPAITSADQYNIEANPINVAVFSLLVAAGLIVLIHRGDQVGALLRENWPILLFFAYCALSTLWSDYPGAAFRKWLRSLGDPVMVLIVLTDSEPVTALKRLFARAGFLLLPLSVLFIKYYPALGRRVSNSGMESIGVSQQKNGLGVVCLVLGLGCLWQFLEHYQTKDEPQRGRHLLAQGAILAMVVWLLRMSDSVTSLSCFLMATSLYLVTGLSAWGQKRAVVHLLVAAMVGCPKNVMVG